MEITLMLFGFGALSAGYVIEETLDIAPVWSGHPVGFCLLTAGKHQYVAFYDENRQMTVASREIDQDSWRFVKLDEHVEWDSHNYVTMTVDDDGYIHLSGNMHCAPLVYFRTTLPYDITTLNRIGEMVGEREQRCTYPRFFRGANSELIFTYRDGSSGNGDQIYNVYDHKSRRWRRLLDSPLTSGKGEMNAYLFGPVRGPDGYFHLCWVWRNTSDCATNHDLSYARSRDLANWEKSDGTKLDLPITIETAEVVDPVPPNGGIINGNAVVGFDANKAPIISYHKYDESGFTQIYNARLENGGWRIYRTSDWDYRWEFSGGGSIKFEIRVGPVKLLPDGRLVQNYSHVKYGSGTWQLDPETLKPVGSVSIGRPLPKEVTALESDFPGMTVRRARDSGRPGERGVSYIIRWETLGPNRDKPRTGETPPSSMLRLFKLRFRRE